MQSTKFMILTGHLNDYPLADLVGILRHQRKTGRLLIEYTISPCSFYFDEGNLVDAQLGTLSGLQALLVALSQPAASFNFNPLLQPTRRTINDSSQKVIFEMLGSWDEKTIEGEAATGNGNSLLAVETTEHAPAGFERELLPAKEVLTLPPSSIEQQASGRRYRRVLIASAIISLVVSFITVAALTRWIIKRDISEALSQVSKDRESTASRGERESLSTQTVRVIVEVENGHVSQARIEEHKPGLEAYETLAMRIARSRRYAATANGQDTVTVKINSPK